MGMREWTRTPFCGLSYISRDLLTSWPSGEQSRLKIRLRLGPLRWAGEQQEEVYKWIFYIPPDITCGLIIIDDHHRRSRSISGRAVRIFLYIYFKSAMWDSIVLDRPASWGPFLTGPGGDRWVGEKNRRILLLVRCVINANSTVGVQFGLNSYAIIFQ